MKDRKMNVEEAMKKYAGRLNDADASASVTGACGDTMEFYLNMGGDKISEVLFYADGCGYTAACGAVAAFYADGRALEEALFVSPGLILKTLGNVPADHRHCAILAATTLHKAIADHLLKD
jgi:nitrogen fixation NifU-like protein